MSSLSILIHQLKSKLCPVQTLFQYHGNDWKKNVMTISTCPFPNVLWKSEHMELVLIGWKEQQTLYHYSGFGAVHSLILQGELSHQVSYPTYKEVGMVPQTYSLSPFGIWKIHANKPSVSLCLYQYAHEK